VHFGDILKTRLGDYLENILLFNFKAKLLIGIVDRQSQISPVSTFNVCEWGSYQASRMMMIQIQIY